MQKSVAQLRAAADSDNPELKRLGVLIALFQDCETRGEIDRHLWYLMDRFVTHPSHEDPLTPIIG